MDILKKYKKLQNGSDIRGVAIDGVQGEDVNLTPEVACNIAKGFAKWLYGKTAQSQHALKVSIGMDPRISGPELKKGLVCGLKSFDSCQSMTVLDCGLASTPAMFMSTVFPESDCDGAIMITASHLPYNRNGFKFFDRAGGLNKADITEILESAAAFSAESGCCGENTDCCAPSDREKSESGCAPSDCVKSEPGCAPTETLFTGTAIEFDLMTLYCDHLKNIIKDRLQGDEITGNKGEILGTESSDNTTDNSTAGNIEIATANSTAKNCDNTTETSTTDNTKAVKALNPDKPLAGIKIIVDAGNGAGGFFATRILEPLGADISGSQFLDPDGNFPNHQPNPENKDAMASICKAVKKNKADLGLIFDTDVDRSAAVDSNSNEISRNGIVALAAALVAEKHPGTTVVTDSITSDQLTVFLEQSLGLKHLSFKRGYKNVINKAIELNEEGIESALAIETSGHAAIKDNYFLDDGAYLATLIVVKTASLFRYGKKIDSVIDALEHPEEADEIRIPIAGEDFAETADRVLASVTAYFEQNPLFDIAFEDEGSRDNGFEGGGEGGVDGAGENSADSFAGGGVQGGVDGAGDRQIQDNPYSDGISLAIEIVRPNYEGVRLAFKIRTPGSGSCALSETQSDDYDAQQNANCDEQQNAECDAQQNVDCDERQNADCDAQQNVDNNIFGWCLLRKSLHDPIIPMNVEANVPGGAKLISLLIYNLLTQFPELDLSVFA